MSDLTDLRRAAIQWYRAWILEFQGIETPPFNGVETPELVESMNEYDRIEDEIHAVLSRTES